MLPASTLVTPVREEGQAPGVTSSGARTHSKGLPKLPQRGGHFVSKDFVSRLAPPESPRSAASGSSSENSLSFWSAFPAAPSLACPLPLAASCDVDAPTNELPLLSPVAPPDSGARTTYRRGEMPASPLKMQSLSSSSSEFSYAASEDMYELDWRGELDEHGCARQPAARLLSCGTPPARPVVGQHLYAEEAHVHPAQTIAPIYPPTIQAVQEPGYSHSCNVEELMEDSARRTHRALLVIGSETDAESYSNSCRQREPVKVAEEFFPAFTWANFHLSQMKDKEESKKGFFSAFVKAVIVCNESARKLDTNLSASISETQLGAVTSMHLGRQLVQEVMQGVPDAWREPLRSWRGLLSELANLYCLYLFAELSGLYCSGAPARVAWVGLRCLLVALTAPVMLPPALHLARQCWRDLRRAFKPQYPDDINGGSDTFEELRRMLRTLKKWVCCLVLLISRTLNAGNGSGTLAAASCISVPAGQSLTRHVLAHVFEACVRLITKLQQDTQTFLVRISPSTILHNQALNRRETLLAEAIMESEHFFRTRGAHLQTRWTSLMLREAKIDKKRSQLETRMEELERREEQLRDMEEAVFHPVSDLRTPQGTGRNLGIENPVCDSPFDVNCRASLENLQQLSTTQSRPSEDSRSAWVEDQVAFTRRTAENFLRAVESSRNKSNQDLVVPPVESRYDPSLEATRAWVYETEHPKDSTQTSVEKGKSSEDSRAHAQSNLQRGIGASPAQVKVEPKHRGGKTMTRLRRLMTASFLTKKKSAAPLPH